MNEETNASVETSVDEFDAGWADEGFQPDYADYEPAEAAEDGEKTDEAEANTKSEEVTDSENQTGESNSESTVSEEKKPEETITDNLAAPKKNPNVKIRLGKPFRGCIGGTVYDFKRGEVAIVPENVRRILSKEEGLLRPL